VGEVYIPMKVDKRGKKFGFVKFKKVEDVEELEGRLQDVWVGETRLRVSIARFGREAAKQTVPEVHRNREVKEVMVVPERSFKDVAQGVANHLDGGQKDCPMLEVFPTEGVLEELRRSFVGCLWSQTEDKKVEMLLRMERFEGGNYGMFLIKMLPCETIRRMS